MSELQAPFPYFGGKRTVADLVWERFGDVPNYVEPFAGSLAVLLGRPHWDPDEGVWRTNERNRTETINDLDGSVTNFWRAVKADPEQVAAWASNPCHELDLHARHLWLHRRLKSTDGLDAAALAYARRKGVLPFAAWLTMDPAAYDAQVAGWWAWGLSSWIGDNWCQPTAQNAMPHLSSAGQGVSRQMPHLSNAGRGVNRQMPHLSDAGQGVNRKMPHLGNAGTGVNRKMPHLGDEGKGECARRLDVLVQWMQRLADRLRNVDVCCGDWERICGYSPTNHRASPCGVFLDPPYSQDHGLDTVYSEHDPGVAARVRAWCIARGAESDMRIAICGYDTEHGELERHGWAVTAWKAAGGYGNQGDDSRGRDNAARERIWWSPGCRQAVDEPTLFEVATAAE